MIWNKAQHALGESKLKDLKMDLLKHEPDEVNLKKVKAHNQDKDGLLEAGVRKRLLVILQRYNLDKYYDDIHPPVDNEHERKKDNLNRVTEPITEDDIHAAFKHTFRDKRLDKLWKKAEESGFQPEELMILHEEFQHQQDKLDEHYETMNELHGDLERKIDSLVNNIESTMDLHMGKLPGRKETPSEKKIRLNDNINQNLKDKYSDIKKDIDKLHKKIISGRVRDDQGPYDEQPVNELWAAAINANFTMEELESLKEELDHYETRIKKLKHFQNQLERNMIGGAKDTQSYGEESEEQKQIKKRVKELKHKVAKTHDLLEKKIGRPKDEL